MADTTSSSKRRRRNDDDDDDSYCRRRPRRKQQHLYLALDDWEGGYSIHKLDPDDILLEPDDQQRRRRRHNPPTAAAAVGDDDGLLIKLPEPPVLRLASPVRGGPMAFAALGANRIVVATNPRCSHDRAPPTMIYDTESGALSGGPHLPDRLHDFGASMAVGERLYALTSVCLVLDESPSFHVLSWAPAAASTRPEGEEQQQLGRWDPTMEWSWSSLPSPSPPFNGRDIVTYALHPDGHTIFVSTTTRDGDADTRCFDTSKGVWRELGDWALPFRGQAYFDAELDALVGIHRKDDGYLCCCPVPSRSAVTAQPPECRMLKERLFRNDQGVPDHRRLTTALCYMGDSRFCLVESFMPRQGALDAVLHVTLFGLKYDHQGQLRTKIRHRATRSYAVSKNTYRFSPAAFWM